MSFNPAGSFLNAPYCFIVTRFCAKGGLAAQHLDGVQSDGALDQAGLLPIKIS